MRDQIITRALANAAYLLGTDYSKDKRNNIYKGGAMDCSSYTAAIWAAAGYPLLDSSGNELRTSCYQVNAVGFELVYPETKAQIGKNLPSPKGLLSAYGARAGDIVFWCFDKDTTRKNKITHVGSIDADGKHIIHTANNKEKCCRKPLTYGDGSICAIIRLMENAVPPRLEPIQRPGEGGIRPDEWRVRMLQVALNIQRGEKLTVDGLFGAKCEAAVAALNAQLGAPGKVCTLETWAALGLTGGEVPTIMSVPEPTGPDNPYHAVCTGGSVYVRAGRGTQNGIFGTAHKGDKLLALPEKDGWCEVAAVLEGCMAVGYMAEKYVSEV